MNAQDLLRVDLKSLLKHAITRDGNEKVHAVLTKVIKAGENMKKPLTPDPKVPLGRLWSPGYPRIDGVPRVLHK